MSVDNPINGYGGYNAIEIDQGVLLFSRTKEGFGLFHDYMSLCMDNLYNPLCDNTYFNLHYIESNNPALREKCDIALKFPQKHLPLQLPINDECFTGRDVLKESIDVKVNSWEPSPEQIQRITDYVAGVHIPVRGDTFDISSLQEIAEGVSYNRVLLSGMMSDFKYEKEFTELAREMDNCSNGTEAAVLAENMRILATDILQKDYPDRRKEQESSLKPPIEFEYDFQQKDGLGYYNAIEEDKGVLLFSRTEEGKMLFEKTQETYLDNFYNPACDNTYFHIHYLESNNGELKGLSDLALKYPLIQQSGFPIDQRLFTDRNVLKHSIREAKFSWKPGFEQIDKMLNFQLDGKYMPIGGDTWNISNLQEIAKDGGSYYNLAMHGIGGFKYNNDFKELADTALSYSGHIHQYKVADALKDKAREILVRDYPDIRKENISSVKKEKPILEVQPQKKKGRGL